MSKRGRTIPYKRICRRCGQMFQGGKYSKICPSCTVIPLNRMKKEDWEKFEQKINDNETIKRWKISNDNKTQNGKQ